MMHETGYGVLTDAQWDELAPLIEACHPHHKTACVALRRTIEAILWRHSNGAKWRSIPPFIFHIPPQRMPRNSQHSTDLSNRCALIRIQFSGELYLLRRQRRRPSSTLASRPGRLKPCIRPHSDDIPLEFRQCPEDVEDEFSAGGGGVDLLRDAFKANLPVVKLSDTSDMNILKSR
jgi:transposase